MKKRKTVIYASSWLPMTTLDIQVEACQKLADEQGLTVSGIYQDFNCDTVPPRQRRYFADLYAAIKRGEVKTLLLTTLGRLGRDEKATAKLMRELKSHGVEVVETWKEEKTNG